MHAGVAGGAGVAVGAADTVGSGVVGSGATAIGWSRSRGRSGV